MAKREKSRKKGRKSRGMGSIVTMRSLKGLGMVEASTFVPLAVGGLLTGGFVALVRRMLPLDVGSRNNALVVKWAPLLGLGVGIVGGLGYANFVSKKKSDAGLAASAAVIVSGSLFAQDFLVLGNRAGSVQTAIAGVGAIVPELGGFGGVTVLEPWNQDARPDSLGRLGMGAIVPELGSAGATISLGNLDTSAFGSNAFHA